MSSNTSVYLGDHFSSFAQSCLDSGRYASISEVVRAGLRLLEEKDISHEEKVQNLHASLLEGLNSGTPMPINFEEFLRDLHLENGCI